jgi:hypothetical protein
VEKTSGDVQTFPEGSSGEFREQAAAAVTNSEILDEISARIKIEATVNDAWWSPKHTNALSASSHIAAKKCEIKQVGSHRTL